MASFKKGDTVRVSMPGHPQHGLVAEVKSVGWVGVRTRDGREFFWSSRVIEQVDDDDMVVRRLPQQQVSLGKGA